MYCFVIFQKGLRSVFHESSQTAWFFLHHFQHLSLYSNQFTQNINTLYTIIFLDESLYLFHVGLPVNLLNVLLPFSILATCPAHLNFLDLVTLTILGKQYKQWTSSLRGFSTPHSRPSSVQIFASGSCF